MKLRGSRDQKRGAFIEVAVRDWQGRVRKKFLPRLGWEELEEDFYVLSSTLRWVCPLFLLRKDGALMGFEGREAVEKERGK